jgi:putative component of membrane protein insertase Oxa1/YidC/SpoIIIJ protein YidD
MTEFGKPFAAAGFGNWFREQCDMANCSPHQIAAITGHASLKEIALDRKRIARAAMEKVKTGTSSVKPDERFDTNRKSS